MGHGIDALFRLVITWELYGQLCQNVFHFRAREDDHSDTLDEDVNFMIGDTKQWIIDPMLEFMSGDVQLLQSVATTLAPLGGANAINLWSGVGGLREGAALPSFTAAVISTHTGYTGRRTHGRSYVCGVPLPDANGNNLSDSALTRLVNVATSWRNRYGRDGTSTRWYGVVFSKKNGVTRDPGPPPELHYLPLAGIPWRYVDARQSLFTQRHRLQGRGM
jgi:hypothetical protein